MRDKYAPLLLSEKGKVFVIVATASLLVAGIYGVTKVFGWCGFLCGRFLVFHVLGINQSTNQSNHLAERHNKLLYVVARAFQFHQCGYIHVCYCI